MTNILRKTILRAVVAAVAFSSFQLWAQPADTESDAGEGEYALEEIIVTAQKREQNLQDVGVSVTAIDSTALARGGISDLTRIEFLTPGMSYGFIGTDAKIAIRGANSNNTFADNQSIAGFFVDGVFRPRAAQQVQQFFDIERVEVLKGPQGTLYGRNTFAGAVNLYSRRPVIDELSAGINVDISRYNTYRTEAFFNYPVNDDLALRLAINTKDSDGYIENRGSGADHGQDEARNLRLSALWEPTDNVEVLLRFTRLDNEGIAGGIFAAEGLCRPVNSAGTTDVFGLGEICDVARAGTVGPFFLETPNEISYNDNTIRDWREDNVTADLSWDFNDNVTLRSISSWTDFDSKYDTDGDFSNTPGYIFYWDEAAESITQEFQLHYVSDGPFSATAGLYWSDDEISFGFSQFRAGIFPFSDFADFQEIDVTTFAVFMQAEFAVSENVRLIAGARYNDEEKDTKSFFGSSTDTGPFTADPATSTPLPGIIYPDLANGIQGSLAGRPIDLYEYTLTAGATASQSFDELTWKLGVEWDVNDDVMLYNSVSTGFLSGGVNADGTRFEQQDNISYEVGMKSRWANDTVQWNVAAYHVEGSSLTTQVGVLDANGVFITSTVNGGEVDTDGLEVELVWLPSDKWTVSANLSIMDAEHKEFGAGNPFTEQAGSVPAGNFLDLQGTEPPWSPDATLGLSVSYDIDLAGGARLTPYLQYYYSSEFNTDDVVLYAQQVQEAYHKTDFRLIWTSAKGNISAEAYVENIEDNEVLARTNVGGGGFVQTSYGYPRNYGIKFSYSFDGG